jgi:thioredoxin 1
MKRLHRIQGKKRVSFSILAIFCFILFSSGCTDISDSDNNAESTGVTTDANNSGGEAGMVEVTNLDQIDKALNKGPVVLKLGSKGCIPCQKQEEILSELLPLYQDKASIMLIDLNKYPEFAATFGVRSIPDTCIIAGIEDGKYMYMRPDGSKSLERASSRFLGVVDKETLSATLDQALESRNVKE